MTPHSDSLGHPVCLQSRAPAAPAVGAAEQQRPGTCSCSLSVIHLTAGGGQVTYSTYQEGDYSAIWDRYAYIRGNSEWFQKVGAPATKRSAAGEHTRR